MLQFLKVSIIESESGWGQKVDSTKYYRLDQRPEAEAYVKEFNSHNTAEETPGWYMRAEGPHMVWIDEGLVPLIVEEAKKLSRKKRKQRSVDPRG